MIQKCYPRPSPRQRIVLFDQSIKNTLSHIFPFNTSNHQLAMVDQTFMFRHICFFFHHWTKAKKVNIGRYLLPTINVLLKKPADNLHSSLHGAKHFKVGSRFFFLVPSLNQKNSCYMTTLCA